MKSATGTAEEILIMFAYELPDKLKQLSQKIPRNEFCEGQMSAFVECIELIAKHWQDAEKYGLTQDFEKKYNIE